MPTCCVDCAPKLFVLTAGHRVLYPGGRIAFSSIHIPPGLSDRDRRRGVRTGPPAVATPSTDPNLLRSARFVDLVGGDVTAAYLDTARAWPRHGQQHVEQLATLEPPGAFLGKLFRRRAAIGAMEAGLLRRSLFLATRPPAGRDGPAFTATGPRPARADWRAG